MSNWMRGILPKKSHEQWKAIARREVGTSHEATKTPCQDYADYKQYGDYLIGVVADGAGSRRYSEDGAKLAVDVTLRYFTEILDNLRGRFLFTSLNDAKDKFHNLIDQVRTELETEAGNFSKKYNEKISADQFACTLLVFVVFPEGIGAMQLGDGFIVVRDYKCQEYNLLFSPSKGEYVNETTFVTSSPNDIAQDLQIIYRSNPVSFICASTDGLEKVALDLANNKAFPRFFIPLENYIQNTQELYQDTYITDFLKSEQVNRKTDDDKTILLCTHIKADPAPDINRTVLDSKISTPLPATKTTPPVVGGIEHFKYKPTQQYPNSVQSGFIDHKQSNAEDFKRSLKIANRDKGVIIRLLIFSNALLVFFASLFWLLLWGTGRYHFFTIVGFFLVLILIIVYSSNWASLVDGINENNRNNSKINAPDYESLAVSSTFISLLLSVLVYFFRLHGIL